MKTLFPSLLYVHYAQHKVKFQSTHIFPSRTTCNYELSYFLNDSSCRLILDNIEYQVSGDTVVLRHPGEQNQSFMPYESILIGFTFDPKETSTSDQQSARVSHPLLNNIPSINHPLKQINYRQIFEDIYKESLLAREFSSHYSSAKILEILYALYYESNSFVTSNHQSITDSHLIDLLKYIEMHLSNDFTIQTMSKDLSISERNIYNLFKKYLNVTPSKYINETKLNYAKNLLSTSNLSVQEIATMCGYDNSTYFITLFRKTVGSTPLKYRNSVQSSYLIN